MAKFSFKLQNFLNIKEKIEQYKRQEYSIAKAKLEEKKKEKACLEALVEEHVISFKESIKVKMNPIEFTNYDKYLHSIRKKIIFQMDLIKEAEKYAETKSFELREAIKDRKIIERLKEKQFEEYKLSEKVLEQKLADEIVGYRSNLKGR